MILLNLLKKEDDISALWTELLSGILERHIRKNYGYDVDIDIHDATMVTSKDRVKVHLNIDAEMSKEEYKMLIKSLMKNQR